MPTYRALEPVTVAWLCLWRSKVVNQLTLRRFSWIPRWAKAPTKVLGSRGRGRDVREAEVMREAGWE